MTDDRQNAYALVTGGAGFIGTNVAKRLLENGETVVLLDDLSRPQVERNVRWLCARYGDRVRMERRDCRDFPAVLELVQGASCVFHLAAQVAVTTSLADPLGDFDVNARGTLQVLEALRRVPRPIPLVFTSTNKVYGPLSDIALREKDSGVEPRDDRIRTSGIDESRPLQFHSPYGCSKGAADQYVLDYARTFGIPAIVFRMSCIYGPHQFGTEDQGWLAHFLLRALSNLPVTIYGDGLQVRDALFVEDLVDAFLLARANIERLKGNAFNMGGGPENVTSVLQLLDTLEALIGKRPSIEFEPPRIADQRYYVSDIGRFARATGFRPRVGIRHGLERLADWAVENASIGFSGFHEMRNPHAVAAMSARGRG